MNKDMKFSYIHEEYSFYDLEEHVRDSIVYDISTGFDITEEEAIEIAEDLTFEYLANINYRLTV